MRNVIHQTQFQRQTNKFPRRLNGAIFIAPAQKNLNALYLVRTEIHFGLIGTTNPPVAHCEANPLLHPHAFLARARDTGIVEPDFSAHPILDGRHRRVCRSTQLCIGITVSRERAHTD